MQAALCGRCRSPVVAGRDLGHGENGSGKSTLMKILRQRQAQQGRDPRIERSTVKIRQRPCRPESRAARHRPHPSRSSNLHTDLDVAGNVFLGREPTWGGRLIPFRAINPMAAELTGRLELSRNARTRVADLAVGEQQLVEIARALSLRSRILILDEPTSSLTERETALLFKVLAGSRRGIVVYISHRQRNRDDRRSGRRLRHGRNAERMSRDLRDRPRRDRAAP